MKIAVGILCMCSVTAAPIYGQGRGQTPPPPATDSVAPDIPGAVKGGTKVTVIKDDFQGTEGPIALPDGTLAFTEGGRELRQVPRRGEHAEWRRLLRQSTTTGRAVLQRVLDGRITFTPDGTGYQFSASTRFDKLFSGIVVPRPSWIPEGGGPNFGPEDTMDLDYGHLLQRMTLAKGVCALQDSNLRPPGS